MNRFAHAMPFGATVLPEGGAWFRLWAPAQERVRLVLGEAGATRPMEQREGGWFAHVVAPDDLKRPVAGLAWPIGKVIAAWPAGLAVGARLDQLPPWGVVWTLTPSSDDP